MATISLPHIRSTATSNSPVATYAITPTLVDPNGRLTNYNFAITNGTLTVLRASSVITWTNPVPIIYGTPLSSNQLNATATVGGTFVYSPTNGTVLNVGSNTLSVVFTPTDTLDYNPATNTVTLVDSTRAVEHHRQQCQPFVWPGQPCLQRDSPGRGQRRQHHRDLCDHGHHQQSGGNYSIVPTPVDPNSRLTNYNAFTLNNGTLTINSAGSLVTWTNPAPVIYGTPLSTNQLDATATVGGNICLCDR